MRLPGFLRSAPTDEPEPTDHRPGRDYAARGCLIGCIAAQVCWLIPIPVAAVVWLFDLKGPFGDIMLMVLPFLLMLPLVGGGIGLLMKHLHSAR